jgi:lipopolysaccharide transport system permease protein
VDTRPKLNMEELVIEAGRTERHYWRDLWRYRELFYFLAWRDILVRYKQTVIGVAWSVIRPFLTMVVFTLIFGKLAGLEERTEGVPYPILIFVALLPWQFFSNSLTESSQSLVLNANLISKIYFPRLIVPTSAVIVSLVDFAISFALLVLMIIGYMVFTDYSFAWSWKLLALPFLLLIAFAAAMGAGLWLGALNVKYRDFRYVVPFIVQFGLYISPVGFSSDIVSDKFGETGRLLYSLNPMVGVIDGFRWACLGEGATLYLPGFALSLVLVALVLVTGIWYFRRTEKGFADVI